LYGFTTSIWSARFAGKKYNNLRYILSSLYACNIFDIRVNLIKLRIIVQIVLQSDQPGTTKILRIKILNGVNLAKKDIFGAR